jgi:hypothetical protein
MNLSATLIENWPKLAWVAATCNGEEVIRILHGPWRIARYVPWVCRMAMPIRLVGRSTAIH